MKNLLTKTLFISLLLSAAIPSGTQAKGLKEIAVVATAIGTAGIGAISAAIKIQAVIEEIGENVVVESATIVGTIPVTETAEALGTTGFLAIKVAGMLAISAAEKVAEALGTAIGTVI